VFSAIASGRALKYNLAESAPLGIKTRFWALLPLVIKTPHP